jgi:hypothetical protein
MKYETDIFTSLPDEEVDEVCEALNAVRETS